ncbi:MAG: amidohydrolase family protein [Gammaproteobacteria bacterium]|nr:amidohydrolase family protein [Gammaproteobacteria bacterium]
MKIAILNARVIDPKNQVDENTNVYIQDGRIIARAANLDGFKPDHVIDAKNYIVCPGLVDLNANVTKGARWENTFTQNLRLALEAGITHFATNAFIKERSFSPQEIKYLNQLSGSKLAKPYFIGSLTQDQQGQRLSELSLLKDAGCIGFTPGTLNSSNTLVSRRCYDYAAMLDLKIFITPNDYYLSQQGFMHEGAVSARIGVAGIPVLAETIALAKELLLIEATEIKAHFGRISAAKSVELLIAANKKLPITSDVAIHQLYLTENEVRLENGLCHVQPPFRSTSDLNSLRKAIKEGHIEAITSDQINLSKQVKQVPFQDSEPGIASWPLLLPLALRLAREESISLLNVIEFITSAPAAILGIDAGHLTVDTSANITIFDPNQTWVLSEQELQRYGTNNPFAAGELQGKIKYTIVDGRIVYQASA